MENPDEVIARVLEWARADSRVTAVILTGSRGRGERVDRFSDLDIEVIGPRPLELAADDAWITQIGQPMVVLPFDEPDLTSRLVVLPEGRKIDFSLWPESRITEMAEHGLNDLYGRGYKVLVDKSGFTQQLPTAALGRPIPQRPDQAAFARVESEFWFEATQVAVYLARRDLWAVKFRENTMHECLLTMLEWRAESDSSDPRYTWHIGHHMDEWLPSSDYESVGEVFTHIDVEDTIRGVSAAMELFERATAEAAENLRLNFRPELAEAAGRHVRGLLASL